MEDECSNSLALGVYPEDLPACRTTYREAFNTRQPFMMEYRLRRHDGEYRWIRNNGRPYSELDGSFAGYVGSCYDITDYKEQEKKLTFLANHDALTGLPNRRSLGDHLNRAIARARRGHFSALLFMDLDNFKTVNDTLGHDAGDQVLATVTRLIRNELRQEDMLARLGGDEFAVLLDAASGEDAEIAAERIRTTVAHHNFDLCGQHFDLSLSIGLTPVDGNLDCNALLARADEAMYKAKFHGKNRVVSSTSPGA
jgi:diguanylate cyclase (GGDEF)-like protein